MKRCSKLLNINYVNRKISEKNTTDDIVIDCLYTNFVIL